MVLLLSQEMSTVRKVDSLQRTVGSPGSEEPLGEDDFGGSMGSKAKQNHVLLKKRPTFWA